jgi:hypothetical protein
MKTAGRENPNRCATVHSNRDHRTAGQNRSLLNQVGCEARKTPAVGEVSFLTSPLIELTKISLCREGKNSPDAGGARVQILLSSAARLVASRPWFLLGVEPDIPLRSQPSKGLHRRLSLCTPASLKINQREQRELSLLRPVGLTARPGRRFAEESLPSTSVYAAVRISFSTTRRFRCARSTTIR